MCWSFVSQLTGVFMFRTFPHYEFKSRLPSELFGGGSGTKYWRAFEVVFDDFWFLGEFLIAESAADEMPSWKTFAANHIDDMIVQANQPAVREHRLNLIIPVHHNPDRFITMKPITEIIKGEDEHGQMVTIYVTGDGSRYVSTSVDANEAEVKNKTTSYMKRDVEVR